MKDKKTELDVLADIARKTLLKDGFHAPTLLVHGSENNCVLQISELGDSHEARTAQMFMAGYTLARVGELGVLQSVFFISEAWLTVLPEGKELTVLPSQDPQRKEVLMISQLEIPSKATAMRSFEMQRDKQGKLLGLEKRPSFGTELSLESPLLNAFVMGFLGMATNPDD